MDQVSGITPAQMWSVVAGLAAVDAVLLALLTRWIRPPWPTRLPVALLLTGALFFSALFAWAFRTYWDGCYGAVLPGCFRTFAPFLGAILGALGWCFWWVARKISDRWCVPLFLALGSFEFGFYWMLILAVSGLVVSAAGRAESA